MLSASFEFAADLVASRALVAFFPLGAGGFEASWLSTMRVGGFVISASFADCLLDTRFLEACGIAFAEALSIAVFARRFAGTLGSVIATFVSAAYFAVPFTLALVRRSELSESFGSGTLLVSGGAVVVFR